MEEIRDKNTITINFTKDEIKVLKGILFCIGGRREGPREVINKFVSITEHVVPDPEERVLSEFVYLPDSWEEFHKKYDGLKEVK